MELFDKTCLECSEVFTHRYSTSFYKGIQVLHPSLRKPIHGIYGFVRLADEIVDTFHQFPKRELLDEFKVQVYKAIDGKLSTNPILHSFQLVVNEYSIPKELIDSFLLSMEMDLDKTSYSTDEYKKYIYGSAEVVGLMCLKVFCKGNEVKYSNLTPAARRLGEAFQKVNFLRDVRDDYLGKGRVYFPLVDFKNFTEIQKREIEADIEADFDAALIGLKQLPNEAKPGVLLAYVYFRELLNAIRRVKANDITNRRIRVSDLVKIYLLIKVKLMIAFRAI
jgi:phytoene/squalene synthetase